MKLGWWMIAGSLLSFFGIAVFLGAQASPGVRLAVWLGMMGPLVAAFSVWLAVEREYRRHPEGVTRLLMKAFLAKMVFLGGYVALVLKTGWVQPIPFAISFVGYFLALHVAEALRLRRLFSKA